MALASLLAAGVPLAIAVAPADAVSANCTAWKQTKSQSGSLDANRAAASCTSIGSTTKVRATLDRSGASDYHSDWFTTTNKTYYSGWATCYAGCSARYDTASR